MINTSIGLVSGMVGTAVSTSPTTPVWVSIVIAVVPPVIGVLWDVFRHIAEKKGWFSKKTGEEIDKIVNNVIDDVTDDGKLNNSNKDNE